MLRASGVGLAAAALAPALAPMRSVAAEPDRAGTPTEQRPLVALPASLTQVFDVYFGNYASGMRIAELTYRFAHDAGQYRASTDGHAIGLVALVYSGQLVQSSEGRMEPSGLKPERYAEKRGKRPERELRFDHREGRMIGVGTPPEVPMPNGTQDRLSIIYQLSMLARTYPGRFAADRQFRIPLASMKTVDLATLTSAGDEELAVDGRTLAGLKVKVRNEASRDDPKIDIWLGRADAMLPVRIRFEESDGKVIDQVYRSKG